MTETIGNGDGRTWNSASSDVMTRGYNLFQEGFVKTDGYYEEEDISVDSVRVVKFVEPIYKDVAYKIFDRGVPITNTFYCVTESWTGAAGDDDWWNINNWSPAQDIPKFSCDNVIFDNDDDVTIPSEIKQLGSITLDNTGSVTQSANFTCQTLTVDSGTWDTNYFNLTTTGSSLTLNGGTFQGRTGTHVLGSLTVSNAASVRHSTATYEVHGNCSIGRNGWRRSSETLKMFTGELQFYSGNNSYGVQTTRIAAGETVTLVRDWELDRYAGIVFEPGSEVIGDVSWQRDIEFPGWTTRGAIWDDQGTTLRNIYVKYGRGMNRINQTYDFSNNCSLFLYGVMYQLEEDLDVDNQLEWWHQTGGVQTNGYNVHAGYIVMRSNYAYGGFPSMRIRDGSVVTVDGSVYATDTDPDAYGLDFRNGGGELRIGGNLIGSGRAFTIVEPSSGNMVFFGTGDQNCRADNPLLPSIETDKESGSLTFTQSLSAEELTCEDAGVSLSFASDETFYFELVEISGSSGNEVVISRSGGSGTDQYSIDAIVANIDYADISNCIAVTSITATNSIDSGNNTGITFT